MAAYDALADLPLTIDAYELEGRRRQIGEFDRRTTTFHLRGAGQEGLGEDVTYDPEQQAAQQDAGPVLPFAGEWTLDSFSRHLDGIDLFHGAEPTMPAFREYRRWAVESAAADLALRQAGTSLAAALGRTPEPITFVVSLRLGEPPSLEPVTRRVAAYPFVQFKLDSSPIVGRRVRRRAGRDRRGRVGRLQGRLQGDGRRHPDRPGPLPARRRAAAGRVPRGSGPHRGGADAALEPYRHRITWDAPIHGVADIEKLAFLPRTINVKPSRIGTWRELLRTYEWCAERDITCYGGGQSELGVGRGQIQYLASIFHPHSPNDIAPSGYDWPDFPETGLPPSPLPPDLESTGFRRRS